MKQHNNFKANKLAILSWGIFLSIMIILSVTPNLVYLDNGSDKMAHITIYTVIIIGLSLFISRYIVIYISSLILLLFGVFIEFLQSFSPERYSSIEDIYANIIGIISGLVIGYLIRTGYYVNLK